MKVILSIFIFLSLVSCSGESGSTNNRVEKVESEENTTEVVPEKEENISDEVVILPPIIKSLYLSGIAIDGYVAGGNVSIYGKESGKLLYSTITDENGSWEFSADQNFSEETFVKISGGTDIATGGGFEGILQSSVSENKKAISTPLSTIVFANLMNQNSLYSSGVAIDSLGRKIKNTDTTLQTEDELWEILADKIGVSKEVFENDPIADLEKNSSTSEESAKIIKNLLMVQKNIEIMSKSIATENNFNDVFSSVAIGVGKVLLKPKPIYLSGIAIDGYLSGGKVQVFGKESGKLLFETETDKAGNWKIELEEEPNEETYVKIIGGIDRSTGQLFEGNLQSSAKVGEKSISNPLSTLVTTQLLRQRSTYSSGVAIDSLPRGIKNIDENSTLHTEDELWEILAEKIGVEKDLLRSDTLRKIDENGTDSEQHTKVLKTMLMVQKNSELITKSVANSENSDDVFSAVNIGMAKTFFPEKKPFYLSGVAIDGYLDKGKVQVFGKESGELLFETETDSEGNWEIGLDQEPNEETYVKIVGGIDISTGEEFEGNLQASVKVGEKSVANPLSTLVTTQLFTQKSIYSSGVAIDSLGRKVKNIEKTEDELWEHLAEKIGVDVADLKSDTLKELDENSSDSGKHAKVLKAMLIVQKNSEMITKSVSNSENKNSIFESVNQGMATTVFKSIYSSGVAIDNLSRETKNVESFEDMFLSSSDTILEETTSSLVKNGIFSEEEKGSVSAKLESSKNALETVTKSLSSIDETELSNGGKEEINLMAKSLEIVSSKLEDSLEEVAKISNSDPNFTTEIESNQKDLEKTAGAITVSGGISGIKNIVKSSLENLEDGKTIDVSSFSSVLSDEVIEVNSKIYEKLVENGVSPDSILEASSQNAESGEDISLLETISANSPELSENLSSLNDEISALENEAKSSLENSVTETLKTAIIDIPEVEEESFDEAMLNSTDSILEETANELVSTILSEDEKGAISTKLESSKNALETVTNSLASTNLNSVEAFAKSLDVVSSKLESSLEEIAKISNSDPDFENALADGKSNLEKINGAIAVSGGISAIQNIIGDSLSNLENGETIDISKLDILSDEVVEANSKIYDKLVENGVSPSSILEASSQNAESGGEASLLETISANLPELSENLSALNEEISVLENEAKNSLENSLNSSLENAVTENQFSDDDLILVEETELSLEDTLLESSAEIFEESLNSIIESGIFSEDQRDTLSLKIESSKESLQNLNNMMKNIDSNTLLDGVEELQLVSQSIEVVTETVENVLSSIADISEDDPEFSEKIEKAQAESDKTVGAIIVGGGLDGVQNAIASAGSDANLENIISDDLIETNSKIYETLIEAGVSPENILEASTTKANSDENISILDEISKIDPTSSLDSLKDEIEQLEKEAQDNLNNAIENSETDTGTGENSETDTGTGENSETDTGTGENSETDTGTGENSETDTGTGENSETDTGTGENSETDTVTPVPTQIFYLNKWWSYSQYLQLMAIMGEAPPSAMTDKNIYDYSDPDNPNEEPDDTTDIAIDIGFDEKDFDDLTDADISWQDFQDIEDLEKLNDLINSRDFDSTAMLLALMMDFAKLDENLTSFKKLVLENDFENVEDVQTLKDLIFDINFSAQDKETESLKDLLFNSSFESQEDLESLKDLLISLDIESYDENLKDLKDLVFSVDFDITKDMETLKDLLFLIDFSEQNENLESLKTLIFFQTFEDQTDLDSLKDILFSVDFETQYENLKSIKDFIFNIDFEFVENMENLKNLLFSLDFSEQSEDFESLKTLIFFETFENQTDLESFKNLLFSLDFSEQSEDFEKLKDFIFKAEFQNVEDMENIKDLLFSLDFSEQSEDFDKLKDFIFNQNFQDKTDLEKFKDLILSMNFETVSNDLTGIKDIVFNADFTQYLEDLETLKNMLFSLDFSEQSEDLENLKTLIFFETFENQTDLESFKNLLFSLDFSEQSEDLENLKTLIFEAEFQNVEDMENIKDLLFSLDFAEQSENLEKLNDFMFNQTFQNQTDLEKLQDLVLSMDFETVNNYLENLKNITFNADFENQSDLENLKSMLFSIDFQIQNEELEKVKDLFFNASFQTQTDLEKVKDLFFSIDFQAVENQLESIKNLVFNIDFENQNDLEKLKDLIFSLDFEVVNENSSKLKDLIFDSSFAIQSDLESLKDLIFSSDFETTDEDFVKIRDLLFNIDFQNYNTSLIKLSDLIFSTDFDPVKDLNQLTELIFSANFEELNPEFFKIHDLIFSSDFNTVTDLGKLKTLLFTIDFQKADENLTSLKDLILSNDFLSKDENLFTLKELLFEVNFELHNDSLESLKDMAFSYDFTTQSEDFEKLKELLFSMDFLETDEDIELLKDMLFAINFENQDEYLEKLKDIFSSEDFAEYSGVYEKLRDLVLDSNFDAQSEIIENLKDLVSSSDFSEDYTQAVETLKNLIMALDFNKVDSNIDTLKDFLFSANFNSDFNSTEEKITNLLFARDFGIYEEDFERLKALTFDEDFQKELDETVEKINNLLFSKDFEEKSENMETLKGFLFSADFNQNFDQNVEYLKNIIFSLDFSAKDNYMETIKDLLFDNAFSEVNETVVELRELIFSLDFAQRYNTFETLKDFLFTADMVEKPEEIIRMYNLIFSLSFPTYNMEISKIQDIYFSNGVFQFSSVEDTEYFKDIIFRNDFNASAEAILNLIYLEADGNSTALLEREGDMNFPLLASEIPTFDGGVKFSQLYNLCRNIMFDYDNEKALDCLDNTLSSSLHYEFIRIGFMEEEEEE